MFKYTQIVYLEFWTRSQVKRWSFKLLATLFIFKLYEWFSNIERGTSLWLQKKNVIVKEKCDSIAIYQNVFAFQL